MYVAGVIHPDVIVDSDSSVLSVSSDLIPCALCPNDAQIEKLQAMSASDLDSAISTKEKEITAAESNFKVRLRMRRPTPLPPFKCKARKLLELRALEATEQRGFRALCSPYLVQDGSNTRVSCDP